LLPVPLPPDVTAIHDALLVAVHLQVLDDAVTAIAPVLPFKPNALLVGEIVYMHPVFFV
jgi:hypothetical protein